MLLVNMENVNATAHLFTHGAEILKSTRNLKNIINTPSFITILD